MTETSPWAPPALLTPLLVAGGTYFKLCVLAIYGLLAALGCELFGNRSYFSSVLGLLVLSVGPDT